KVRLCVRELARVDALALQPADLLHDEAQGLAGRLGTRIGLRDEIACLLERMNVRRGAVCKSALRSQNAMEPVRALAPQNLEGQVNGHVIRVLARDREVANANLGLHGIRLVDDDDAACG